MECQWIQPERHQLEVAALGTEPVGPTYQEYGVKPEVANRVAAELGASDLALDALFSATSADLSVSEKYLSTQDSAWKKHWGPHHGSDVDALSQSGHSKGGCEDPQGRFQGSVRRPHALY